LRWWSDRSTGLSLLPRIESIGIEVTSLFGGADERTRSSYEATKKDSMTDFAPIPFRIRIGVMDHVHHFVWED
jgi:hypothetical protein